MYSLTSWWTFRVFLSFVFWNEAAIKVHFGVHSYLTIKRRLFSFPLVKYGGGMLDQVAGAC